MDTDAEPALSPNMAVQNSWKKELIQHLMKKNPQFSLLLTNIFRITTEMCTILFDPFECHCLIFEASIARNAYPLIVKRYKSYKIIENNNSKKHDIHFRLTELKKKMTLIYTFVLYSFWSV